jgi:hypothetical protein
MISPCFGKLVIGIGWSDFRARFAERLSSAMNALGAERAARSTIRDKRVHSL